MLSILDFRRDAFGSKSHMDDQQHERIVAYESRNVSLFFNTCSCVCRVGNKNCEPDSLRSIEEKISPVADAFCFKTRYRGRHNVEASSCVSEH